MADLDRLTFLLEISENLKLLGEGIVHEHELTYPMYRILRLADAEPSTAAAVARATGVTRQNVQVMVNRLVQLKMLTSTENPEDRRAPLLKLTKKGRDRYLAAKKDLANASKKLMRNSNNKHLEQELENLQSSMSEWLTASKVDENQVHYRHLGRRLESES